MSPSEGPARQVDLRTSGEFAVTDQSVVEIRSVPYTSEAAHKLRAEADAYNESLYGHADQSPIDPHQFDPDRGGIFLIAYRDGEPVACGGIRPAEPPAPDNAAEVKRMYVVEHARHQGLARLVLAALEDVARRYGYQQVVLDVGRKQHGAHRLYESSGYTRIEGFTIYRDIPGNRAYAKVLT